MGILFLFFFLFIFSRVSMSCFCSVFCRVLFICCFFFCFLSFLRFALVCYYNWLNSCSCVRILCSDYSFFPFFFFLFHFLPNLCFSALFCLICGLFFCPLSAKLWLQSGQKMLSKCLFFVFLFVFCVGCDVKVFFSVLFLWFFLFHVVFCLFFFAFSGKLSMQSS